MTSLVQFLKMQDQMIRQCNSARNWKYKSMEDFVLTHGVQCNSQVLPGQYERGQVKQCFMNAFNLMMKHPELRYVEGYGHSIIPTLHAWCVDENLNVIDPTWDDSEKSVYFGVVFNRDYVLEATLQRGHYGLIDNYNERFPLLQGNEKDFLDTTFV